MKGSLSKGDQALETASGTGTYEWLPVEDRIQWSPGLLRIYGVVEAPDAERHFSDLVHPDDRVRVEAETIGLLESRADSYSHTFRIVRPDGTVRLVLDRGVIERHPDGRVRRLSGINVDITDVALGGTASQPVTAHGEKATELEALYAEAPLGLALLDRELRFVRINRALAGINGFPPEAHIGRTAWDLVPHLRASAEPALMQVLASGKPLRDVMVRGETAAKPGVPRVWQENFYPLRGADGAILGVGVVCEEVTDRVATFEALAESEARLKRAARAAGFGVHDFDPHLRRAVWSAELFRIMGLSEAGGPVPFETVLATIHPDNRERTLAAMDAIQRRVGPYMIENRIVRPNGAVRWIADRGESIGPIDPGTGLCARVTGTVMDVTEQKAA